METPINLDANASYGLLDEVLDSLRSYNQGGFNPSSIHQGGQRMRALIERAREQVAELISMDSSSARVVFTSGATESNNMAISLPYLEELSYQGPHPDNSPEGHGYSCIVSASEHPSVLAPLARLENYGVRTKILTPNSSGTIPVEELISQISNHTKLVSIMLANNETGQINDVSRICKEVKSRFPDILVHTDAVQAAGKIEVDFESLGVDMLSLSAHKIGGLTGVGALVVKKQLECVPLITGGSQELRWRSGTENIVGILTFGVASEVMRVGLDENSKRMLKGRELIAAQLQSRLPDCVFHAAGGSSLPNTLSVRLPGVHADDLVVALDLQGVLISSGAACSSGKPTPSHVLLAQGLSEGEARETVRLSLRADWKRAELERASDLLIDCVARMRDTAVANG